MAYIFDDPFKKPPPLPGELPNFDDLIRPPTALAPGAGLPQTVLPMSTMTGLAPQAPNLPPPGVNAPAPTAPTAPASAPTAGTGRQSILSEALGNPTTQRIVNAGIQSPIPGRMTGGRLEQNYRANRGYDRQQEADQYGAPAMQSERATRAADAQTQLSASRRALMAEQEQMRAAGRAKQDAYNQRNAGAPQLMRWTGSDGTTVEEKGTLGGGTTSRTLTTAGGVTGSITPQEQQQMAQEQGQVTRLEANRAMAQEDAAKAAAKARTARNAAVYANPQSAYLAEQMAAGKRQDEQLNVLDSIITKRRAARGVQ